MSPDTPTSQTKKTRRMLAWLLAIVVGMFVFAVFILPPMYDVFCKITGLNGKIALVAKKAPVTSPNIQTKLAATIKMQFLATADKEIPWIFRPDVSQMMIAPGEVYETHFYVKNTSDYPMAGRAVPSVSPEIMHSYLNKIECFCFQEQHLAPGEEKEMPLRFYISKDAPKDVKDFTLSYTLYKAKSSS